MRLLFLVIGCLFFSFCFGQHKQYYLFVGTYTIDKSEGIYVYKFNEDSGTASFVSKIKTDNPSYLAISNNHRFVYAVKEGGMENISGASAFSFDGKTGQLTFLNRQRTKGNGPCFIAVDSKNRWVFTANYKGGSLSAFPVKDDGSLDTVTQFIQHIGSSINPTRQKEPHVHTVVFSPDEKYLFTNDLGTDKINRYTFTTSTLSTPLSEGSDSVTHSTPGNGPRHLAFSPNQKFVYIINELAGSIDVFSYSPKRLSLVQTISTNGTDSANQASADIHLSPDGKFLYATNRGNLNTISAFAVNPSSGRLKLLQVLPTGGIMPRNFTITPSGNRLLVGHQKSGFITVFNRDTDTGLLTLTNNTIPVSNAVCLKLIEVE